MSNEFDTIDDKIQTHFLTTFYTIENVVGERKEAKIYFYFRNELHFIDPIAALRNIVLYRDFKF